ncbi:hypothetical protein ASPACDRAFT_43561 [Aspergillus aculeatus ATCC 16872]|uniref:BTB domain-containing protein n=1 Tax=Aspergillus aculeatus (strain ATCC 16872 / CBS 172.66 / WB 5094) TaxID=690307 RepID=A0A1L9WUJ0_ASPA1|nr:uncharacterized protein ASPACDRAFT_43561 [Aspergillus aculeatus ATCC 16872]OJJ99924.1 hypothetical protein ASPACDRAFT_43561 [Aspergillus aculeatus ATCC 16872]
MGKKNPKKKNTNLKSRNKAEGLQASEPEPEPEHVPELEPEPELEPDHEPEHEPQLEPESELEPEPQPEPDPVADLSIPELLDYTQRDESPYMTSPITFKVGKEYYTILQYYLRPFPQLKCNPSDLHRAPDTYNQWGIRSLGPVYQLELTIEPQAAHTFIHYLSTGQYETLRSEFAPIENAADVTETLRARDIEELTRAAHTYAAAVLYEVPGLQELAKGFLVRFAERLPTEDILKVTREIYDSLRHMEPARAWLEVFVRGRLEAAFSDREVSLRQIIREYDVGRGGSFDRFIVDETLAIFERDREEVNQALSGLGEPEEVAELEPLSESGLVPDPEPGLEAELASESESESEPEPEPEP